MDLLDGIKSTFKDKYLSNDNIKELMRLLKSGEANYIHAQIYSQEVGKMLSKTFDELLLDDMALGFDEVSTIMNSTLKTNYALVDSYSTNVQRLINKEMGFDLKVISSKYPQDKIDGFIYRMSSSENIGDIKWITQAPIENFTQSVCDETIQANVEMQGELGIKAKVVRELVGKACPWCIELSGTYEYPNVPQEVYRRHDNCMCTLEYIPTNGKGKTLHRGGGMRQFVKNEKGVYTRVTNKK